MKSIPFSEDLLLKRCKEKTGYELNLSNYYKLCDLKPLNGHWFSEYIADTAQRQNWPIYALGPYSNKDFEKPDLVLADGRFRVACVLAAILNLGSDARVLVHDFPWRKKYHRVLKFCEKVEEVDTLIVLTAKKDFNRNEAQKMFQEFIFNPIDPTKGERFLKKIVKTVLDDKRAKKIAHGGTREV